MTTTSERDRDGVFGARIGLGLRELDGLERIPDVSLDVLRRLEETAAAPERSPQRWLALLAALLAVAVVTTLLVNGGRGPGDAAGAVAAQEPVGQEPVGPWRLVYELPADELRRSSPGKSREELEQLVEQTVGELQRRLGAPALVARGEAATIHVTFANAAAGEVAAARALLENPGRLAMRALADGDYVADGGKVRFDLAKERQQLQAWLDRGGRERLHQDLRAVAEYRAASEHLRWFVRRVRPDAERAGSWGARFVDIPQLAASTVAASADGDWNGGTIPAHMQARPAEQRILVELVAVNMHERHFSEADVLPSSVALRTELAGPTVVTYRLREAKAAEYADFSEKHLGKCCAFLWNDELLSAPRFESRIPGVGEIRGLPALQAVEVAKLLATPVATPLRFVDSQRHAPR